MTPRVSIPVTPRVSVPVTPRVSVPVTPRVSVPVTPRVSVIVPVYNVAGYVGACLRSIAGQSMDAFEVIVIDDGSSDGSGDLARQAVGADPRFTFLRQDNAGLSAARNTGLDRARAPYIAFVDSDDQIAPTYLQRLLETIEKTGADWVSCGISFREKGRPPVSHSAIHDRQAWRLRKGDRPERHDFGDWREVARHFPSAWNKLYRREILGDLRFDPGMLYEDHAFYWRYAARTDHLLRLPEPLYLSTQGRVGQITRDGSDNVFQQYEVLRILDTVSAQSDKTGRSAALDQITTRLIFERAEAITNLDRWTRFVQAGQAFMAQHGRGLDRALGVPRWWADVLERRVSVSVIVPSDGRAGPLRRSLDSLAKQRCRSIEVLVVPEDDAPDRAALYQLAGRYAGVSVLAGAKGPEDARRRGLDAARGHAVVFLEPGDRLGPHALGNWHHRLYEAGAQMGFAPMQLQGPQTGAGQARLRHSGLQDRRAMSSRQLKALEGIAPKPRHALEIHAHPSAKIFERAILTQTLPDLPGGALSMTHLMARICTQATRIVGLDVPALIETDPARSPLWRRPHSAEALRGALTQMQQDKALRLPGGWAVRLWARLVWEQLCFADHGAGQAAFETALAGLSEGLRAPGTAGLDPAIDARTRRLIGLPEI